MDKEQKESIKIQQVNIELNNLSVSELEPPHNPLYNIKLLDSDRTKQVGTISAISGQDGIMELIYSFLTPTDVVNLERTCKRYVNVKRTRRIAIGSRLYVNPSSKDTIENAIVDYVNNTSDSSAIALQKLITKVKPIVRPGLLPRYGFTSWEFMDPVSFETFFVSAFSNLSWKEADLLCEGIEWWYLSIWDFKIVRFLFQQEHTFVKHRLLSKIINRLNEPEVGRFTEVFFKYSLDLEVMKLALSIDDDDDEMQELKDKSFMILNNTMLVRSMARRDEMSKEDPLYGHTMEFYSLFVENVPNDYPGEIDLERGLFDFDKDTIKQYWIDDPSMLQMWKVALFKTLKWVREFEKAGLVSDYLLLSRIILAVESRQKHCFSLGPFLVMMSVESGGAVALSVRLEEDDAVIDLFYNYYSFLILYRKGYRKLKEWGERTLATHAAATAAIEHAANQP